MFSALIAIPVFGTVIWSFFNPSAASKLFLILATLFEIIVFLSSRYGRPNHIEVFSPPFYFDAIDVSMFKKYHLFFKFPYISRQLSSAMSAILLSSMILIPWLLYKGLWETAIAIGVNFLIAGHLNTLLNPRILSSTATGSSELKAIDSVLEKIARRHEE